MCKLQKTSTNFKNSNRITFIIILTSALCIVVSCFNIAYGFIREKDIIFLNFPGAEDGDISIFIKSVILAPIFETLLNQSLPYYLLNKVKYLSERRYLILLISAFLFGITHFYSLFYIIFACIMGIVLMFGYMIRIRTDKKTYYLIAFCHSLVNLGVFIKNLL